MVATKDKQEPVSIEAKIGARDVRLSFHYPRLTKDGMAHDELSLLFQNDLSAKKTPYEHSGAILPATILVQGFKDNGKNTAFTLSLDSNFTSQKTISTSALPFRRAVDSNDERAIRISKIESYGEDSSLSAALLKDIALESLLRECLRLVAFRIRYFPAGEWDLNNFPHKRTKASTEWIQVAKGSVEHSILFGADSKDAAEWALALADRKKSSWDSEQVLKAVARLYEQTPKVKDRALWISKQLENEGFVSTRGEPFTKATVNSQIREARERKLISASNRKKQTK